MPSQVFDEGLPVVFMESLALHRPVVSTYIAGIPELAVDGETALVVPAGNPDALAVALRRACTDEELRARLVARAREAVERLHDETDTLPAFLETIGYAEQTTS